MRRRLLAILVALTAGLTWVGVTPATPVLAYNTECCPWRNPSDIYVGVYGQGVPPYLMDAIGQALNGWNGSTALGLVWEDRSDYNADIIVVPYWQNAGSINGGNWAGYGGCKTLDNSGRWCVHAEVDLNLDGSTSDSWLMRDQDAGIRPLQVYSIEHEFGHAVGLDHSCKNAQIMTGPQSQYCSNQSYYNCGQYNQPACPTTPQRDDIQGISALYPGGNSSGSGGCAGTAPPVNPNALPLPATPSPPIPSLLPSPPPPPTELPLPSTRPPAADVPVPDWVPTTPTPIPAPVSTDPTQYYPYQNGVDMLHETEQDPTRPAQLGEAAAYNQVARANGLWPGGQRVHVAPVGTDNLPSVGAADIALNFGYDTTIPAESRPC